MHITRLRLVDFRNYERLDWAPDPGSNLLLGSNAVGKTNVLEAIATLATSRSPRASRDSELIRFGRTSAHLLAEADSVGQGGLTVEMILAPPEAPAATGSISRTVRVNSVKKARVSEFMGILRVVAFWPDDDDLVRGDPSHRRRLMNIALCQVSPRYCHDLGRYRRALAQRNRLLKALKAGAGGSALQSLPAWDEQLAHYGARVIQRRAAFVDSLQPLAAEIHQALTGDREEFNVSYAPHCAPGADESETERLYLDRLRGRRSDEIMRGITLSGPHRDDLALRINGADARTYGSMGQQRTAALSLKVGELRLMEEETGEPCIVLMDETFGELDEARAGRVLEDVLSGRQGFVTSTGARRLPESFLQHSAVWRMEDGGWKMEDGRSKMDRANSED